MTNPFEAWAAAKDAADPLHDRAILLGYNVGANISGEFGSNQVAVSFWVRRFDLPSGNEAHFDTAEAVNRYLTEIELLHQRYSLALVGNPRIRTEPDPETDGFATWISDTKTGERFGVRTRDLETATTLYIYAGSIPTIGNWELASPESVG